MTACGSGRITGPLVDTAFGTAFADGPDMSMPRISPQVVLTALALPLFSLACVEDPTEGGDDIAADTGDANTTDGTDATDGAEMGTDGGTTTDGTDTTDT
ncbi:MAG: hypothetical protein KC431_05875, partial [Myxococcales bacterium]|nr:hypothetical protein [Myxococcales bacterium]